MGKYRKPKKLGIVMVMFDEEGAITEGEVEVELPRYPLVEDNVFRTACLAAFRKAGGDRTHQ